MDQPTSPLRGTGKDSSQYPSWRKFITTKVGWILRDASQSRGVDEVVSEGLQGSPRGDAFCLCIALLLEQIVAPGIDPFEGSERTEETTRVEEVQAVHRQEDHGTVHNVEVELCGDNPALHPALPTIDKFDGSIHGSDVDGEGTESNSEEHRLHFPVHEVVARGWFVVRALEGLIADVTEDKLDGEYHVNGDGDRLEEDAAQHDPATLLRILVVTSSNCSEDTTNTLNGERDQISGKEDEGI